MPLTIKNRGRRAAVIQLDASQMKRRLEVLTSKRHPTTGKKTIVKKNRVLGDALTILCGEEATLLPNGQPIPDILKMHPQVTGNSDLIVSQLSKEKWDSKHRPRARPAPKSRKRTASAVEEG